MLCQSLTTLHALLSSHLFAIKRRLPLHVLWWTGCFPYLVFQKCCTLIEAHNLKTKSSESYKHYVVTKKLEPHRIGHKVVQYWRVCIVPVSYTHLTLPTKA